MYPSSRTGTPRAAATAPSTLANSNGRAMATFTTMAPLQLVARVRAGTAEAAQDAIEALGKSGIQALVAIGHTPPDIVITDLVMPHMNGVEVLRQLPERNRFMKGLFAWVGFNSIGVPYERPQRAADRLDDRPAGLAVGGPDARRLAGEHLDRVRVRQRAGELGLAHQGVAAAERRHELGEPLDHRLEGAAGERRRVEEIGRAHV